MLGWILQWKAYVPGHRVGHRHRLRRLSTAVSHEPSSKVTVWFALSPLVHVIDSPAATLRPVGNVKSLISAAVPVPLPVLHAPAAAEAGADAAGRRRRGRRCRPGRTPRACDAGAARGPAAARAGGEGERRDRDESPEAESSGHAGLLLLRAPGAGAARV